MVSINSVKRYANVVSIYPQFFTNPANKQTILTQINNVKKQKLKDINLFLGRKYKTLASAKAQLRIIEQSLNHFFPAPIIEKDDLFGRPTKFYSSLIKRKSPFTMIDKKLEVMDEFQKTIKIYNQSNRKYVVIWSTELDVWIDDDILDNCEQNLLGRMNFSYLLPLLNVNRFQIIAYLDNALIISSNAYFTFSGYYIAYRNAIDDLIKKLRAFTPELYENTISGVDAYKEATLDESYEVLGTSLVRLEFVFWFVNNYSVKTIYGMWK